MPALFLVQGLVIGLAVAALLRLLRGRSADLRYGVACAGLLAMGALARSGRRPEGSRRAGVHRNPRPPASVAPGTARAWAGRGAARGSGRTRPIEASVAEASSKEARVHAIAATAAVTTTVRLGWRERVEAFLPVVVAAWLVGVCVLALRLLRGLAEVRGLSREGLIGPTGEIRATIGRLVERAGLRYPVDWFLSVRVEVPTVVGWVRPRVLIPAGILARLTLGQVEALLAHEIAHIRRWDYLVNMVQVGAEALLFFHPSVWWVSGRIRNEREHCCDDMAVALCDGDRRLLARCRSSTLEEQRVASSLRVAAGGGSLRDRVRRLVVPQSAETCPAHAGWAGAGLIAMAVGLVGLTWLPATTRALDDAPPAGKASVRGRVLDEAGRPVGGARVRLYRRDGRWECRNPMVEQTNAGADGSFVLKTPLQVLPPSRSRGLPPYVLLADHSGKAVGWRTIPNQAGSFEGDIVLTAPGERTITVVDGDDRPVPDVKIGAYSLGDPSSPSPRFQDLMEQLRTDDGPLDGDDRLCRAVPHSASSRGRMPLSSPRSRVSPKPMRSVS